LRDKIGNKIPILLFLSEEKIIFGSDKMGDLAVFCGKCKKSVFLTVKYSILLKKRGIL
jgi:hypothetical protein